MRWRALVVSILLLATALLTAIGRPSPAEALVAADPQLRVLAVRSGSDGQVSLVGQLAPTSPVPLGPVTATVTSGGRNRPAVVSRLLSDRTAVALVVDTSADATASLQAGGRSGTASFLLQLPPNARTAVVADRRPPVLAAPASVGVAQALRATSALPAGGQRATSDALTLALRQVPAEPGGQRLIVLYTNAPDAAGESAPDLGRRLRQANAVLAVVVTAARAQYWQEVAGATGGLAIATRADHAIDAFDTLADELRSRFTVTFPRAAGARQADVRIDAESQVFTTAVALPPAPAVRSGGWSRLWPLVIGVLAAAVGFGLLGLRRPRHGAGPPVPALPGVRVFDVTDPAGPREITNPLFESRIERDARALRGPSRDEDKG